MLSPDLALGPVYWPRFEAKFIPEPNSGCWLWTGACHESGYGRFRCEGVNHPAHRLLFERCSKTELSPEVFACHRCDTPSCVNPGHVFAGTILVNNRDSVAKGRNAFGERVGTAKLTNDDVRAIAAAEGRYDAIADRFGIALQHVHQIKQGTRQARTVGIGSRRQNPPGYFRKLTAPQVRAIRASTKRTVELMAEFGISKTLVRNIKTGVTYGALPQEAPDAEA